MVWAPDAGRGSKIVTLDSFGPPKIKRTDKTKKLLDEGFKAHERGDIERAISAYHQIMGLDRDNVGAMMGAGLLEAERGQVEAAEFLLKRALSIAPTVATYNILGHAYVKRRRFDDAIACYRASIALDPTNLSTWPNLLFALDLHPYATNGLRKAERERFDALHCRPLTEAAAPHDNDPDPERILRVGFVSADFKQHSAAHGFGPVILGHHAGRVEVHLYDVDPSEPNEDDLVAKWFRETASSRWHDVRGHDDATVAATIRADRMDVLVDLSGYSAGGRPLVFARKPAPVQIGGLGYATGFGIAAMDYLIGDDVVTPARHEQLYREQILRLPCFMGYEQAPPWPEIGPSPKERNGHVTYGYFGRALKISTQTLAAWGEILRRVPDSRLLLKCGEYDTDEATPRQIAAALGAFGVSSDRIAFRGGSSRTDHLAAYREIDISLDPFPHNGGVTTVETFLMGVPTVTLIGDYFCGRTGASLLTAFGLAHAAARTPFEYIKHAVSMADDTWTLDDRRALRRRVQSSILMDQSAYAGAFEDAVREAWRTWCAERVAA
jgi:protein O-GlcNAc transferase